MPREEEIAKIKEKVVKVVRTCHEGVLKYDKVSI